MLITIEYRATLSLLKGSRCVIEQETLPSLSVTNWFQKLIRA